MRKKKNLVPRMEQCSGCLIKDPAENKGRWREITGGKPLCLEIGCGKGNFIMGISALHPENFYVAGEIEENVLLMAMEKAAAEQRDNLLFMCCDAAHLAEYFEKGEVSRIYLNFSDPWPGARNRKKRLTSHEMLEVYKKILSPGGEIRFKTDNQPLFMFSMATIPSQGFEVFFKTYDLHSENVENIVTEYEARFTAEGKKIMAVYARLPLQEEEKTI